MGNQCCNEQPPPKTLEIQAKEAASEAIASTPQEVPVEVQAAPTPAAVEAPEPKEEAAPEAEAAPEPEAAKVEVEEAKPEPAPAPEAEKLPKTFEVSVPIKAGKLGINLSAHGGDHGYLSLLEINAGGDAAAFNEANPGSELKQRDRITKLAGKTSVVDMLEAIKTIKSLSALDMTLVRPHEWKVEIPAATTGGGLELSTHDYKELYLTVTKIKPGETVAKFNEANPALAVKEGDRIFSDNHETKGDEVLKRLNNLRENKPVVLYVERVTG